MNSQLLIENLSNPALLFFLLGIIAVQLKSDLEIPESTSKFISMYLLFSIGFKGGQELAHSHLDTTVLWGIVFGIIIAIVIPLYAFFILKKRFSIANAGAVAAAYGSVSAVTFVTAVAFLDSMNLKFGGHMVAVMALMEAPAIVVGVLLIHFFDKDRNRTGLIKVTMKHAFTNGSVLLIVGSLCIGWIASDTQAQGIKPFTTDIFKGFLAIFLLDMGIASGRKLPEFYKNGWFAFFFALLMPLVNGSLVAFASHWITAIPGDRFIFAVLAASASYIAVPAAMRIVVPEANPGLLLPMTLAITFPFNITFGMPLYLYIIQS